MSQFPNLRSLTFPNFSMPSSNLYVSDDEEEKRKEEKFQQWKVDQEKQTRSIATQPIDQAFRKSVESARDDRLGYLLDQAGNGKRRNQLNSLAKSGDELLLDVAVTGDATGSFNVSGAEEAGFASIQGINFRGGSVWGFSYDPNSGAPEVLELSGQNAQASVYIAQRMRGGVSASKTIWDKAKSESDYLRRVFKESDKERQFLDYWTNSSPTFYNVKGSKPLSTYTDENVISILGNTELNEDAQDWDPKKAVEELTVADPKLSSYLFETIGLSQERLIEISKTPLMFKYFIADAIDTYAFAKIISTYADNANIVDEGFSLYVAPMVISSLNSNDTLSELTLLTGGIAASATIAGAPAGIVAIGTAIGNRIRRVTQAGISTVDIVRRAERLEKLLARTIKLNKILGNTFKFLPGNVSDTLFNYTLGKFDKLSFLKYNSADKWFKTTLKFAGRQFISEFGQGMLESVRGQSAYMANGFQESFSVGQLFANGVEEGVGGVFLGGLMKGINYSGKRLFTDAIEPLTMNMIGVNQTTISGLVSPSIRNRVRLVASAFTGIEPLRGGESLSAEEQAQIIRARFQLNEMAIKVSNRSSLGNLLTDDLDPENKPLMDAVLKSIPADSDDDERHIARSTIISILNNLMGRNEEFVLSSENGIIKKPDRLESDEIDVAAFLVAQRMSLENPNGIADQNKLLNAAFKQFLINRQSKLPKAQRDANVNETIDRLTKEGKLEEQRKEFAEFLHQTEISLFSKVGLGSLDEIQSMFLTEDQMNLINEVIEQYGDTEVKVDLPNVPDGGIRETTIKKEEKEVKLDANTTTVGKLEADDEIEFEYSSGTRAGAKRRVRVIGIETNKRGEQVIKGLDLDIGEERNYLTKRITGSFTRFGKTKSKTTSEAEIKPTETPVQAAAQAETTPQEAVPPAATTAQTEPQVAAQEQAEVKQKAEPKTEVDPVIQNLLNSTEQSSSQLDDSDLDRFNQCKIN